MIQEEIFEVDKKIKQIEGILNKRKEKANEWNMHYKKILQEKPNKEEYLDRECQTKKIFRLSNSLQDKQVRLQLEKRCLESRKKIHTFYNELKELDILQKKKNRIRLDNTREVIPNGISKEGDSKQKRSKGEKPKNGANQVFHQTDFCFRNSKDRHNPFSGCKMEKFIEFYQQNKGNQEQLGSKIMRHFGVGVENTPIGSILKREEKKQELKNACEFDKTGGGRQKSSLKKFTSTFQSKQNWFRPAPVKNSKFDFKVVFEDRLKKIMRYHGQFWNEKMPAL